MNDLKMTMLILTICTINNYLGTAFFYVWLVNKNRRQAVDTHDAFCNPTG